MILIIAGMVVFFVGIVGMVKSKALADIIASSALVISGSILVAGA